MTDKQKEFCQILLAPAISLEEKMDGLWELPDEDLAFFMEHFKADEDSEICQAIKRILEEKRLDKNSNPDEFMFSGLV